MSANTTNPEKPARFSKLDAKAQARRAKAQAQREVVKAEIAHRASSTGSPDPAPLSKPGMDAPRPRSLGRGAVCLTIGSGVLFV